MIKRWDSNESQHQDNDVLFQVDLGYIDVYGTFIYIYMFDVNGTFIYISV